MGISYAVSAAVTARLTKRSKGTCNKQVSETGDNAFQKKSLGSGPPFRPPWRRRTLSSSRSRERSCSKAIRERSCPKASRERSSSKASRERSCLRASREISSFKSSGKSSSIRKPSVPGKKKVVYVKTWEHTMESEVTGDFNNNDDIWVVIDMKVVSE